MASGQFPVTAWPAAGSRSTLDQITLQQLAVKWAGWYRLGYLADADGYPDGVYFACRDTGGNPLAAGTLEGLDSAIRADYSRWTAR